MWLPNKRQLIPSGSNKERHYIYGIVDFRGGLGINLKKKNNFEMLFE